MPPTRLWPRLASLMTHSGSWDGDCVRSKAALLICCWPQSQSLRSTSPGWRFKWGIWEWRGRKHATYQHWAEPYRGPQRNAWDQYVEVWCRIWDGVSLQRSCARSRELRWSHGPPVWLKQLSSGCSYRHKGTYALSNKKKKSLSCYI